MPAESPPAGQPRASASRRAPRTRPWSGLVARYDAHRGGRTIVLAWLVTRLVVITLLCTAERVVVGDVFYYWRKVNGLFDVGLPNTLNEYPTPVVWFLWLPYGVTGGIRVGYLIGFVVFMLVLDALFTRALWLSAGRRHIRAIDFWLLFVLLVGPLCYVRFDILPAVLAGGALLAARKRPWVTGALTGLGAAVKLWPALLIGAFAARRADRRTVLASFVGVGFGLAAISLVLGGSTRLFSPLTWQSGRGLQVESVWSTPLMLARGVRPASWTVDYSRFQAYEIFGPGVAPLLSLSNVATVLGLLTIAVLVAKAFRHPDVSPVAVGMIVLATVAIMTITNKTLSPQYLLWMGGPAAALLLLRRDASSDDQLAIGRLSRQLLLLALLTHLVYPLLYDGLLGRQGHAMIVVSTVVTAARNVALVLFTVEVCRFAWKSLGTPRRT